MQGHGGALVLDRLLQRVLGLGARMARPGEFSERAFLNGKMDLAQAEAVADLIDAGHGCGRAGGSALPAGRILRTNSCDCRRSSRSCAHTSKPPSIFPMRRSIFSPTWR